VFGIHKNPMLNISTRKDLLALSVERQTTWDISRQQLGLVAIFFGCLDLFDLPLYRAVFK